MTKRRFCEGSLSMNFECIFQDDINMNMLIKFTDYAKLFQQGKLYMNTLSWFWNNGFEDQSDILEGVIAKVPPRNMHGFDPDFLEAQCVDFQIQAYGYQFCNVFCMSKIDVNISPNGKANVAFPAGMKEFGKYAVIVDDENEFLRRINGAAIKNGYKYLCGRVNYHMQKIDGVDTTAKHQMTLRTKDPCNIEKYIQGDYKKYDSFDKCTKYAHENEWRISLYRGIKSQAAYEFDIGDLRDITHIVEVTDINIIQLLNTCGKLRQSIDCYYGNIGRKELRHLFYQLGDNKGWIISTIG